MASARNLQPMPPFDPKMDISTVAQRWQQWLKRFKRYLLAKSIFDTLPDRDVARTFKGGGGGALQILSIMIGLTRLSR